MKESGSHSLASKDAGTKDVGAKAIDFGCRSEHTNPSSIKTGRQDSERCYSEYESANRGVPTEQAMKISAKDNGGEKASGGQGGM